MGASAAHRAKQDGMGTEMVHEAFGPHAQEALCAVREEAGRLEALLSRFLPDSDICRVNRSAGVRGERLSREAYEVLQRAAAFSRLSHGMFDVTIGPLVDLWDYKHAAEAPDDASMRRILPLVNHHDLLLDPTERTARLRKPGQSIDVGGIAKGYASGRLIDVFRENGVASAYTNIGGNVSTLGCKPDGAPWRVGIRHPRQASLLGAVAVSGQSVVTSGDYERFFVDRQGKRYHHILDPRTGYPAESGLASVTVVCEDAMTADALSTTLFVAGLEAGLELLRGFPEAHAVFVDTGIQVAVTPGLKGYFQAASGIDIRYERIGSS